MKTISCIWRLSAFSAERIGKELESVNTQHANVFFTVLKEANALDKNFFQGLIWTDNQVIADSLGSRQSFTARPQRLAILGKHPHARS